MRIRPDDFKDDWYGWLTNQCGHVVLGLAVSVSAYYAGAWLLYAPFFSAFLYWLLVEFFGQSVKLWRDSIADTLFVMLGACVLPAYDRGDLTLAIVFAVAALGFAYGVWRRA